MAVLGDLLFYRGDQVDLDAVLRHQKELLRHKVDSLSEQLFAEKADEEIANQIAQSEAIAPLQLDLPAAKADVREVTVEVDDRFSRGAVEVPGFRATKSIPFNGEAQLWHLQPNSFDLNPPRGEVVGRTLVVGIDVTAQGVEQAKKYIEDTIASIPTYLERQRKQIDAYNGQIATSALHLIQQRRSRLNAASDLLKKLQS